LRLHRTHGRVSYGHAFARMDGLLMNDSRRLTPGGAPMLNVCMYATRKSRSIQESVMSFTRSSVQELPYAVGQCFHMSRKLCSSRGFTPGREVDIARFIARQHLMFTRPQGPSVRERLGAGSHTHSPIFT
jgi:hypothetical protein